MNNNYINNNILATINSAALILAEVFNGKVTRNDTTKNGNVLTDEELNKYHESIYIARVEFSDERHNAVEITATTTQFYVAYGDTVAENVKSFVDGITEKAERKAKWNMKNKCYVNVDTFTDALGKLAKKPTTKQSATKAKKQSATKAKKQSAKATKTA